MRRARLRGAVFGVGRMGTFHRDRLRERGDVEVLEVDPPRGLTPSLEGIDFAVIATPSSTHAVVALPLLERGIPCLIEKPLAATIDEARALAAFPHAMVGHIERFNPALEPVLAVRPRFVQCERLAPFQDRGTEVSVVDDLMIHDLDLVLHFLGHDVKEIRAIGIGVVTGQPDICNVRLEIGEGVAVLTASRVSREPVRKVRLVEQGVYWSVDLMERAIVRVDWGAKDLAGRPVTVPPGDALIREHEAFLTAVRGGAAFPILAADALLGLELADRVRHELGGR